MSVRHLLNRTLTHARPTTVPDGSGGSTTTMVDLDPIRCRTSQPSTTERLYAAQAQAQHDQAIYFLPTADVRKGDRLTDPGTGETWRVTATVRPSKPKYLRADAELIETAGGA